MIEAASRLFAKRGFDGCSMEDIAKASGITKPMLYAYFDSKEGLFAVCAERAGEQLGEEMRAVGERGDLTPDRQLWEGLQRLFAFVDENHDSWLLLYPEGAAATGSIGSGAAAARDAMADLLTEQFTRCRAGAGPGGRGARAHRGDRAHLHRGCDQRRIALGDGAEGAARNRRPEADEPALDGLRLAARGAALAARRVSLACLAETRTD